MKKFLPAAFLFLAACSTVEASHSYKTPSLSGDAGGMSSETLCYRAETTGSEILKDEIRARHLDCREVLESRPLIPDARY